MRIIGGTVGGQKLASLQKVGIRPTSDRIKESIFSILGEEVSGKTVLDLFAGTGNLGIEALSRGAVKAFFVEKSRHALRLIEKNLSKVGLRDGAEIVPGDALRAIGNLCRKGLHFDIIFIDPPYRMGLLDSVLKKLRSHPVYHDRSILIVQHDKREPLPCSGQPWIIYKERKIGDTMISFLKIPESVKPLPESNPSGG